MRNEKGVPATGATGTIELATAADAACANASLVSVAATVGVNASLGGSSACCDGLSASSVASAADILYTGK